MNVEKIVFNYKNGKEDLQSLNAECNRSSRDEEHQNDDDWIFSLPSSLPDGRDPDVAVKIAAILLAASAADGEVLEPELLSAIVSLSEILDVHPKLSLDFLLDGAQLIKRLNDRSAFGKVLRSVAAECSAEKRSAILKAVWRILMSDKSLRWQEVLYADYLSTKLGIDPNSGDEIMFSSLA